MKKFLLSITKILLVLLALPTANCLLLTSSIAQHTFSIVAVDTVTGEVGSAGASCINNSIIISDVHPGRGAIHTQAFWNAGNQNYASTLMDQGYAPAQIIDSLTANDAQGTPQERQYGIADFDSTGNPRTAGFTGTANTDYKNHVLGPNYSIQGNILLGQQILDSMEAGFLNTTGSFAEKLMAALQGAKVPGADTRCTTNGTSSLSSFIRVAKPGDTTGSIYLHLDVNSTPPGVEPIDSLQLLFSSLNTTCNVLKAEFIQSTDTVDLATSSGKILFNDNSQFVSSRFWDMGDATVKTNETVFFHSYNSTGTYTVTLTVSNLNCTNIFTSQVVVVNSKCP